MGETQFLQLLTAQLANQDPTSPMDDTAFVGELAQFSSVEQLTTANSNLESLLVAQTSNNETATADLIGKQVLYNASTVNVGTTGGATMLNASFNGAATGGTATISNSTGQTVATVSFGAEPSGAVQIPWNGMGANGNPVPPGNYTVSFSATGSNGNSVAVTSQATGLVTGVDFSAGYPQLLINGSLVTMSSVDQIQEVPPAA
jgi:flagellar basal-body rod modification protein FlgD